MRQVREWVSQSFRRVDLIEIRDICAVCGTSLEAFVAQLERQLRAAARKPRPKRTRVG